MAVYYPQAVMQLRFRPENFGDDSDTELNKDHVFTVQPKSVTIDLNNYREADTFDAEIDFKSFPVDPRCVRAIGVSIYVEDKGKIVQGGGGASILTPTEENIIFQGFADSQEVNLDGGTRTVSISGRDFTSLLIDQEYLGTPIQTSKPLDKVFRGLLDTLESTKKIKIVNKTGLTTLPVIANFSTSKDSKAGSKNGRKKRSFWDQIQELTLKAGLISYIELDSLVIAKPRTFYDRTASKLFVFGKNLSDLRFERKLGRQKGFNVRVLSYNPEKKDLLEVRLPKDGTETWARDLGIKRETVLVPKTDTTGKEISDKPAPFITFRIRDVADKEQLVEIGQSIYEEIGRQEIEGNLTTKEMLVCDKDKNPFNSNKFRVGTPIELTIEQDDLDGAPKLTDIPDPKKRKTKIKQFLIQKCYDPGIADAMAEALTRFDSPFFTKGVSFKIDSESGWSMDLNFINFIDLPKNLVE